MYTQVSDFLCNWENKYGLVLQRLPIKEKTAEVGVYYFISSIDNHNVLSNCFHKAYHSTTRLLSIALEQQNKISALLCIVILMNNNYSKIGICNVKY